MNEPVGRPGSEMPARDRGTASAHRAHGRLLADEPTTQLGLERQQLLGLALLEAGDRDAGPGRDDRRDVFVGDLVR